jgi:hypothetical protein
MDTASGGFSDWTLVSCSKVGNVFTVSASRPLVTFDEHDLDFVGGPMTLLFSWSQQTPSSPTSLAMHDGGYTPLKVSLWGEQIIALNKSALPSDYDVLEFKMPNVPIGNSTSYTCVGFNITLKDNNATHAIVFEPLVAPENVDYVHHMAIWLCGTPYTGPPFSCFSMPTACKVMLYAWGKGGGPMVLPPETGMAIGTPGRQYVILQMHYTNEGLVGGLQDTSGLRIYRTNQLRQYETGTFLFGTIGVAVPGNMASVSLSGSCNNTETRRLLPPEGVTIYASFLHAHERGRRIWTNVVRNGKVISTIGNNQNYDFNLQTVQSLPRTVLQQDDELVTYCTYDTVGFGNVSWGEESSQEMCFNFLYYYPILNPNVSTTQCGTRGNPVSAGLPGPTSCALQPGHPPAAYNLTSLVPADTNFYTGGSVSCAAGFRGTAALGCSGYGAPFTFSGCSRPPVNTGGDDLSSAALHAVSITAIVTAVLAL